jgi:calcineurin-like phosphoesterase family protein
MLKIKLEPGQKLFITSDTHYNHKNICIGVTAWDLTVMDKSAVRDFNTLDHMNNHIVYSINSVIMEDDILIHLGDWSFGGFESIRTFRDRIVCKNIHLVTGNHDHHIVNNRDNIREIFSSVHEYYTQLEVKYLSAKLNGGMDIMNFILSHFPIASWENMNKGWIHLFGHVHLPLNKKVMQGRSMDVGVDGNYFMPYNIIDCYRMLKDNPIAPTVLPFDHHTEKR